VAVSSGASKRERITLEVVETLQGMVAPKPGIVSRDVLDPENELSSAQFPAISVQSADGEKAPGAKGFYDAVLTITFEGFVKGPNDLDKKRNELIAGIERTLSLDITRKGLATDTRFTGEATDAGSASTDAAVLMVIEVDYTYEKGNP